LPRIFPIPLETHGTEELALTTRIEPGYLHATVKGKFSLKAAQQHFLALLDVIALEQMDHILVDGREVTGKPKMLERFLYGEFVAAAAAQLAERVVLPAPKFAYVLGEQSLDPRRLAETTARKRGMNVKAFDNMEEAIQWLLQPDT
jgi:hypothetical protein